MEEGKSRKRTARVAKDSALAEITLRRYEKPYKLKPRELVKKLCLSIGLLQPADSRDVIVDVLYVLLDAKKSRKELSSKDIEKEVIKLRKKENLALTGIASSNIRRQLKRLRDMFLVERIKARYRIAEFNLLESFSEKTEKFLLESIKSRIKEYMQLAEEMF